MQRKLTHSQTPLLPENRLQYNTLVEQKINNIFSRYSTESLKYSLIELEKDPERIRNKFNTSALSQIISDIEREPPFDITHTLERTQIQKISFFLKNFFGSGTTFPGLFMCLQGFPSVEVKVTDASIAITGAVGFLLFGGAAGYLATSDVNIQDTKNRYQYSILLLRELLLTELIGRTKIAINRRALSCSKWLTVTHDNRNDHRASPLFDIIFFLEKNLASLDLQLFELQTNEILLMAKFLRNSQPGVDLSALPLNKIDEPEGSDETILDYAGDAEISVVSNDSKLKDWSAVKGVIYINLVLSLIGSSVSIFVFENFVKNTIRSFFTIEQPESAWTGIPLESTLLALSLLIGICLSYKNFSIEKGAARSNEQLQALKERADQSMDIYHDSSRCLNILQKVEPLLLHSLFSRPRQAEEKYRQDINEQREDFQIR